MGPLAKVEPDPGLIRARYTAGWTSQHKQVKAADMVKPHICNI